MTETRKENEGTAVEAGTLATERFAQSGKLNKLEVPKERVSQLAGELIQAANDIAIKHEVTYDLQFPHNWLECSTAENRAEWGTKAIIPADSVDEDALILRTEIIDLDGRPKYRSVVEPQA